MIINVKATYSCHCHKQRCEVPPAPELMLELFVRYKGLIAENRLPPTITFKHFLSVWGADRQGENYAGLDDGKMENAPKSSAQLIDRPPGKLQGKTRTIVLLVDFPDRPHRSDRSPSYYEQMLFGDIDVFPTGSMAEYYRRVSNYTTSEGATGIDIEGSVHGWFRLPEPSEYYASGMSGRGTYPRNAQGLAQAALHLAVENGVRFTDNDDIYGEGVVTALFIIHAGSGAEKSGSKDDLWSLKWLLKQPIKVNDHLQASPFLIVPEDCQMGVCAHEWGHLVGRWADFYDTGSEGAAKANGLGNYCLMASGNWNNGGITPCLPNGMLRMFHQWIQPTLVTKTTENIELLPAANGGTIVIIQNPATMRDARQYVFVEYRRREGQDHFLPDEGLAVYTVDERIDNVNDESRLAIELIQADDAHGLTKVFFQGNRGDESDLYPLIRKDGSENRSLGRDTQPPLTLPDGHWSGITIKVRGMAGDNSMFIDVEM